MIKARFLIAGTLLSMTSMMSQATTIIFDNNNGGVAKSGNVVTATSTHYGNPNVWGDTLHFSDFTVTGGRSQNDNLNKGAFNISNINMSAVDQDFNPNHGGLGVCSENVSCAGSSDSFSSNVTNYKSDEVLFLNFSTAVTLDTLWFNGDHHEHVDGSTTTNVNNGANALFNIFFSADGSTYSNIFSNQVRPTDLEYITTGLTDSYQYFAVAASGYGSHDSYLEAVQYTTAVPEPSTLALIGLGLLGLGLSRRKA